MSLTHGYLKAEALKVIGDNVMEDAFTQKQLVEAMNDAMNLSARALGATYLEKPWFQVDSGGYVTLGNEVITTVKVFTGETVPPVTGTIGINSAVTATGGSAPAMTPTLAIVGLTTYEDMAEPSPTEVLVPVILNTGDPADYVGYTEMWVSSIYVGQRAAGSTIWLLAQGTTDWTLSYTVLDTASTPHNYTITDADYPGGSYEYFPGIPGWGIRFDINEMPNLGDDIKNQNVVLDLHDLTTDTHAYATLRYVTHPSS